MSFEAIIRRSIGWFDLPEHSPGELAARLEEDSEAVAKTTGSSLGYRIEVVATLVAGILVSLMYSWQIGLSAVACIPVIVAAPAVQAFCCKRGHVEKDLEGISAATTLEAGLRGLSMV